MRLKIKIWFKKIVIMNRAKFQNPTASGFRCFIRKQYDYFVILRFANFFCKKEI